MADLADSPLWILAVSFAVLWLCGLLGAWLSRQLLEDDAERENLHIVLPASLTLLGLIIGFTFSMAISRYDQRKMYEEGEANAIGTEHARAGLLASGDPQALRSALETYLEQRIAFFDERDRRELPRIATLTEETEQKLWALIETAARSQRDPLMALVTSGMNDVLNSQSYTQAAWRNRIPRSAWALMGLIAMICNVMLGYSARRLARRSLRLAILPFIVAIAFFLVADIDSPRGGIIHVSPQNLMSLAADLQ